MKKKLLLGCFLFVIAAAWGGECPVIPIKIPPPSELAIKYYHSGNVLWIVKQFWTFALMAMILFTGLSAKIRDLSDFLGKRRVVWRFVIFLFIYSILVALVSFPIDYYSGFIRPHKYGLSSQTFTRYLSHYFMSLAILISVSLIVLGVLYFFIAKSPKRWWLYMGFLLVPILIFFQVIQPIWIAPLFNRFGPMKDQRLEEQILALAERAGIENSRVFEVDKSSDTKMMNAYVTGFGFSKRIVLWDTIIKGMNRDELLFVMGHEMGHYVLHHIWWRILLNAVLAMITLFLTSFFANFLIRKCSKRIGFKTLKNIASLPLILLLYGLFSLLFTPLENLFSQMQEHQADRFGLEITHENHAAGTAFLKLLGSNLGYPYPGTLYLLFRSSHPSIGSRIEFFNTYHPWCD